MHAVGNITATFKRYSQYQVMKCSPGATPGVSLATDLKSVNIKIPQVEILTVEVS